MKTGITTDVSETRSQLWKDSQLKISVLMQCLFHLDARLVYSGENWPLLSNSKSSVNTSSICLFKNGRISPETSASLNEHFTSSKSNEFVLTLFVDEFSSHASVLNIETKAPKLDFYFHPVSVARVSEILSNLNIRKLAGTSPKLLKIAAPVIAGPMTKLFNYCIDAGEWPCQWKLSNVTPAHKNDDETSKKNYWPVSVLSVIPQVFEKLKSD